MKKFEYVYFTIYQYHSRQSHFPDSLVVRLKSMYLLAISVGGWILFLQLLFLRFVKNAWFSSHPAAMFYALTVYGVITAVFHKVFIVDEKDQKIYNKYLSSWNNNPNKNRDLFLASLLAAIPYLCMVIIKLTHQN